MEHQKSQSVDEQSSVFDQDDALDQHQRALFQHGIKKARTALFVAGGLMFVVDMVMLLIQRAQVNTAYFYGVVAFDTLILGVFIGLGLWTKRKPYSAILAGLLLFCAIQLLAMVFDPTNIYKGLIVKVVVIITLVSGLKKARALQRMDQFAAGSFE